MTQPGDLVLIELHKWVPAVIERVSPTPRSGMLPELVRSARTVQDDIRLIRSDSWMGLEVFPYATTDIIGAVNEVTTYMLRHNYFLGLNYPEERDLITAFQAPAAVLEARRLQTQVSEATSMLGRYLRRRD